MSSTPKNSNPPKSSTFDFAIKQSANLSPQQTSEATPTKPVREKSTFMDDEVMVVNMADPEHPVFCTMEGYGVFKLDKKRESIYNLFKLSSVS